MCCAILRNDSASVALEVPHDESSSRPLALRHRPFHGAIRLPACSRTAINIDAARKEGKVIAYGTIIPQVMEPLHRNLEKKYGIKVEYWRASATQVMERARSARRAAQDSMLFLPSTVTNPSLSLKGRETFQPTAVCTS